MIDTVMRNVNAYIEQMPGNVPEKVLKSGIYSFVLASVLSGNLQAGALMGGIAATASTVHALTTPLFKRMIGGDVAAWHQRACHQFVNLFITQVAVNAVTSLRINLMSNAALLIGLSILTSGFEERNLNGGGVYLFV